MQNEPIIVCTRTDLNTTQTATRNTGNVATHLKIVFAALPLVHMLAAALTAAHFDPHSQPLARVDQRSHSLESKPEIAARFAETSTVLIERSIPKALDACESALQHLPHLRDDRRARCRCDGFDDCRCRRRRRRCCRRRRLWRRWRRSRPRRRWRWPQSIYRIGHERPINWRRVCRCRRCRRRCRRRRRGRRRGCSCRRLRRRCRRWRWRQRRRRRRWRRLI